MTTKSRALSIFGLMAALCVALLTCVLIFVGEVGVARADDEASAGLQFEISTDDGYDWTLSLDGEVVEEFSGAWANPPYRDVASVAFERVISGIMTERGEDGYALEFILPAIGCNVTDDTTFAYTESETGGVVLKGEYAPIISGDIIKTVQYKSGDGAYVTYGATERDGGLSFGRYVDVGTYSVRLAVYERFIYDGVEYQVPRYSSAVECTVEIAQIDAPEVEGISVVYGTSAADIADGITSMGGEWSLSDEQTVEGLGAATVLGVMDGTYAVKFDYAPSNRNYDTVRGVEIPVTVEPYVLRIYIADAFSLIGEPVVTDISYEVTTALVAGDAIEDLGVEIYVIDCDGSVAGKFPIRASFSNANYMPECKSYQNPLLAGGIYTVYATSLTAEADGIEFEVYIDGGYEDMTLRVERADVASSAVTVGDLVLNPLMAYSFIFEDLDGERVYPQGGYLVRFDYAALGATHATLSGEGLIELTDSGVFMQGDDLLVLYAARHVGGLDEVRVAQVNLALTVLCCVLAAAFIALVTVYARGRRYFK